MRHARMVGSILFGLVAVLPSGAARADNDISFDVPARGDVVGTYLPSGVYVVKAYGTIIYDTTALGPSYADAECTSPGNPVVLDDIAHAYNLYPSPLSGWRAHRYVVTGGGTDLARPRGRHDRAGMGRVAADAGGLGSRSGRTGVDAGCNEKDHTYQYVLTSVGDNHTFRIYDPAPTDNVGALHVVITRVG